MAGEWCELHWGDLASLEYGKGLRGYEDSSGPYRVFGTNGPIGWHDEPLSRATTVVVGRKGAYRGIHYSAEPCFVINTAFYLQPRSEFHMRWAYYALLTQDINAMDSGSAIPSTSRDEFCRLPVAVPPLPEQRAITHILGTLDDKIELNRRMNETLEAMARAIFKSWFVDFDPVRAKAEGRDPGLPKHIADLFPDRFVDSDVGGIPEGWEAKPVPDVVEVNPRRSLRKGEIATYLDMANMPTRGHRAIQLMRRPYGSGSRFTNGDTLLARITPCLEHGKTAFVDFLQDGETGWGSTEYIILRPRPPLPPEFGYFLARDEGLRGHVIQNMTGTSGRQRAPASCLDQYFIAVPPARLAEGFGNLARWTMARVRANDEESHALAALRDALLPKLISGELRVKDAERILEGAL